MKAFLFLAVGLLIISGTGISSALTIGNSSDFEVSLNNGSFITESNASPNKFSSQLFTSRNETKSGEVQFSLIPYFDFGSTLYFQFVYDLQESGGAGEKQISIDDIIVSVTGGTVWDYDQNILGSIILNSTTPYSNTPLGAGGDLALYVPVALFKKMDLKGSDFLTLTVTQSDSDNGTDEWFVRGSDSGGRFFDPDDPILPPSVESVPETGTMILFGLGLIGIAVAGRKKRK